MPIALIPELTATLRKTGKVLAPWTQLVDIEVQLVRRARSAYLTHWFGAGVPERQLSLHIAIRNIAALRKQYLLAERSVEAAPPALNLLGPFAGIAGLLAGMAISPTGLILIGKQMERISNALVDQPWADLITLLYRTVGAVILPVAAPGLILLVGIPLMLFAGIGFAAGGAPAVRKMVSLLGELALMIDALGVFWDQLSGPRDKIRNPLLRRLLETFDAFAGLAVQLLGGIGFLVVRLLPIIPNLLAQFRALVGLIEAVMAALGDIFTGINDALLAPFVRGRGLLGTLLDVFSILLAIPDKIIAATKKLIDSASTELTTAGEAIAKLVKDYSTGFVDRLGKAFVASALGELLDRIKKAKVLITNVITIMEVLGDIEKSVRAALGIKEKKDEPFTETLRGFWLNVLLSNDLFGKGPGTQVADLLEKAEKDIKLPSFPDLPTLPDTTKLLEKHKVPTIPDLGGMVTSLATSAWEAQAKAPLPEELRKSPASVFAEEQRRLEAESGRPVLRLDDARLRDLIYITVGRILPPALRPFAPSVRELFDTIDKQLYDEDIPAQAVPLPPQETLGDNGKLRTMIKQVRFVARSGDEPDLRAFRDLVLEAMQRQAYLAAARPG